MVIPDITPRDAHSDCFARPQSHPSAYLRPAYLKVLHYTFSLSRLILLHTPYALPILCFTSAFSCRAGYACLDPTNWSSLRLTLAANAQRVRNLINCLSLRANLLPVFVMF